MGRQGSPNTHHPERNNLSHIFHRSLVLFTNKSCNYYNSFLDNMLFDNTLLRYLILIKFIITLGTYDYSYFYYLRICLNVSSDFFFSSESHETHIIDY